MDEYIPGAEEPPRRQTVGDDSSLVAPTEERGSERSVEARCDIDRRRGSEVGH